MPGLSHELPEVHDVEDRGTLAESKPFRDVIHSLELSCGVMDGYRKDEEWRCCGEEDPPSRGQRRLARIAAASGGACPGAAGRSDQFASLRVTHARSKQPEILIGEMFQVGVSDCRCSKDVTHIVEEHYVDGHARRGFSVTRR